MADANIKRPFSFIPPAEYATVIALAAVIERTEKGEEIGKQLGDLADLLQRFVANGEKTIPEADVAKILKGEEIIAAARQQVTKLPAVSSPTPHEVLHALESSVKRFERDNSLSASKDVPLHAM